MCKYLVLMVVLVSISATAETSFPFRLKGDCYVAEFLFTNPDDKNVNTICISGEQVVSRMTFSNNGNLPAVCYQKGVAKIVNSREFILTLHSGYCDNGRPFAEDEVICREHSKKKLNCSGSNGTMVIEYVGKFN